MLFIFIYAQVEGVFVIYSFKVDLNYTHHRLDIGIN